MLKCIPVDILKVNAKSELVHCVQLNFPQGVLDLPCASKQLRLTIHKKGEVRQPVEVRQPDFEFVNLKALDLWGDVDKLDQVYELQYNISSGVASCSGCGCNFKVFDLAEADSEGNRCDRVFGIRWSPKQFLMQACLKGHPFDAFSGVDQEVKQACSLLASSSDAEVVNLRAKTLRRWTLKAKDLIGNERLLKEGMTSEMRHILASKRLELMKWIILDAGYHDADLASDMASGFSLVGEASRSGLLPSKFVPAQLTVSDLHGQARRSNTPFVT